MALAVHGTAIAIVVVIRGRIMSATTPQPVLTIRLRRIVARPAVEAVAEAVGAAAAAEQ